MVLLFTHTLTAWIILVHYKKNIINYHSSLMAKGRMVLGTLLYHIRHGVVEDVEPIDIALSILKVKKIVYPDFVTYKKEWPPLVSRSHPSASPYNCTWCLS
jgi:hypothetical protein